jgi:hypothetical protein
MMILACLAVTAACGANILENGGFEVGGPTSAAGFSQHFFTGTYEFKVVTENVHSGGRCVAITAPETGWARWYTTDVFLLKGAKYRLSCWVRSDGTEGKVSGNVWMVGCGANLQLAFGLKPQWTQLSGEFSPTETGRAGLYLQNVGAGTVYFDDVDLEMTAPPPVEAGEPVPTDGEPLTAIVLPAQPALHHLYLATEARRLLEEMTGKTIAIRTDDGKAVGRGLYLGVTPPGKDFKADLARLNDEGVLVDVSPDSVCCQGKTARALNYAVYEFFRLLGCRWYAPGPRGTVIPKVERLTLSPTRIVHNPSFDLRGGTVIQVEARPPKFDLGGINEEQYIDWATMNHMNRLKAAYPQSWNYGAIRGYSWEEYAGHTYSFLVPAEKYWKDHPEYFPLVKGKRTYLHSSGRPAELCVSNPDVAKIMIDGALDFMASHPNAMRFCIDADDEPSYWCECDQCRALDTVRNDFEHQGNGVLDLTDRCMTLVNKVAAAVGKTYPGRWVGTFAYASTREVPHKVKPADNVMVELTWWDRCFKHAMDDPRCPINAKGMQRLRDWQKWTKNITIYGYLQYNNMDVPQVYPRAEADFLRAVHKRGVRCMTDEWDTTFTASALLLSLRARLLWDINTDVDAFVKDFCDRMYGPASAPMQAYYARMQRAVEESPEKHVGFEGVARFTPQVLAECRGLLRKAYDLAPDDTVRARIVEQQFGVNIAEFYGLQAKPDKTQADQIALFDLNDRMLRDATQWDFPVSMGAHNAMYIGYKPPLAAMGAKRLVEMPEMWQFRTDPEDAGEKGQWFLGGKVDAAWKPISIHKAWEGQGYPSYDGYGWYAVDVRLPASAGRAWLLFGAIDETADVWINGEKVGESKGDPAVLWDKPVAIEVTGKYKPDEMNHVVVRVHDSAYAGGIWKPVWLMGN